MSISSSFTAEQFARVRQAITNPEIAEETRRELERQAFENPMGDSGLPTRIRKSHPRKKAFRRSGFLAVHFMQPPENDD
jgi:hypothetical protein